MSAISFEWWGLEEEERKLGEKSVKFKMKGDKIVNCNWTSGDGICQQLFQDLCP